MLYSRADINLDTSFFAALYDGIKEGTAVINAADMQFIYCNQTFLQLFGFSSLHSISFQLFKSLRKDVTDSSRLKAMEQKLQQKGRLVELAEYSSMSGETFFAELTTQYFSKFDETYLLLTINPVDKAFFEIASVGILLMNAAGEIVSSNKYVEEKFGYKKCELVGKTVELLIPERFHHSHVHYRNDFIKHQANRPMGEGKDLIAVKKDGTEIPVEVSLSQYPAEDNQYVVIFIADITERKNAEEAARKFHEELESKVELRTQALRNLLYELEVSRTELEQVNLFQKALLDNAGAIIVSVDTNGIIQIFNPEAERQLGYKASELIGSKTPAVFHSPILKAGKGNAVDSASDREDELEILFRKAREDGKNEVELVYVRKNGTRFPVRLTVTPIKDAQGGIRGYMGIAFDISGIKKIQLELSEALEKEKDLNELKSRFVTMASHEFRTPLSTILSSAYLIEKYTAAEDQPKRQMHLQRVIASVSMLTDTLNDFLSVGKIEEGKIQVRPSYINISQLLKTVIDSFESTLKSRQQILYTHTGETELFLDASLLKHIILNLISNASKFSGEGKKIEVNTVVDEKHLIIAVKDHGMGIAKGDQQHLMERFFRGANAGNIQGTGLGLHIVAKYAELMNGVVECRSELEKGTEFIVTFKRS